MTGHRDILGEITVNNGAVNNGGWNLSLYAHVRFENVALYLSKEAADHSMSSNGFFIEFDKNAVPYEGSIGPKEFNNKFVLIEGTFNKIKRGHHSAYQGTIEKIDRIYELKGPE